MGRNVLVVSTVDHAEDGLRVLELLRHSSKPHGYQMKFMNTILLTV